MDEGAIVTNVATILAKDLLLDRSPKFRPMPYPMQQFRNFMEDDDESLDYFICRMMRRKTRKTHQKIKHPLNGLQYTDDSILLPDIVVNSSAMMRKPTDSLEVNLRISQFLSPRDFEENFHMKKGTFNALLEVLGPLMKEQIRRIDGSLLSKDTFLSLALWKLTTSQHFEEISCRFKIPISVCYQSTANFCDLISNFINTFINWPNRNQMVNIKHQKSTQMIGAIGTKRMDVFLENQDEEIAVILQLVCNSDLIITNCCLELASLYDCQNTPIVKKLCSESLPEGCYLLGDSTFPLKSFLITPYTDSQTQQKLHFNRLINEQLKIINSTVKQMMHRFQVLFSLEARNLNEMKKIVETVCGLHNFCRRLNDNCIPNLPESKICDKTQQINGREKDANGIRRRDELFKTVCAQSIAN